ncbi:hypothetical protein C8E03_11357 [Lachnotalea glycerini]|jgi:hypothetical protein|uniref:Arc family DNA-binding protein n=1 Tax=Lachnotalea glycerini TaxID=1763509 RepID=A0A255IG95_9FIRM|nr:hypothetical protein [Lachnotalea glycerini]OYO67865.1 hypothetical protein CG709_16720 [Lachnotalea glycerini]PXV86272.1 hypothetical protein C8E03_11357 [Lachnotalea glycerini]
MENNLDSKEEKLKERLESLKELEQEILKKEKTLKEKEKSKKQVLLRLSPGLWNELAAWAEDDFRSINGQIEYLLAECVKNRKK